MNTLGSHPGEILFRFSVMVIIILILISVFQNYVEEAEKTFERSSILQTKRIIDSSLAVVFSTYAVNARLDDLNELDGANPFVFLEQYQMLPPAYRGEIDTDMTVTLEPGWYYLKQRKLVGYKTYYLERDTYYAIVLNYDDVNRSGRFEPAIDNFNNLGFVAVTELQR